VKHISLIFFFRVRVRFPDERRGNCNDLPTNFVLNADGRLPAEGKKILSPNDPKRKKTRSAGNEKEGSEEEKEGRVEEGKRRNRGRERERRGIEEEEGRRGEEGRKEGRKEGKNLVNFFRQSFFFFFFFKKREARNQRTGITPSLSPFFTCFLPFTYC